MNTTRRGFLASAAALLGLGSASKSGAAPQPAATSLPRIGAPYLYTEVTLIGGPLYDQRYRVRAEAMAVDFPRVAVNCGYDSVFYERSTQDPRLFVYREAR